MFNRKVALPHAASFVNVLCGHKFNSCALLCLLWKKKPSLDRNVYSEKLKRQLYRIFDLYSQSSKAVYGLQEIVHSNMIFTESVKCLPMCRVIPW